LLARPPIDTQDWGRDESRRSMLAANAWPNRLSRFASGGIVSLRDLETLSVASHPPRSSAPRVGALALISVGAVIMILSIFADSIGLSGGGSGFGWEQLIAAIFGLVLLLVGIAWFLQPIWRQPDERLEE
jgi:hypothetical protein